MSQHHLPRIPARLDHRLRSAGQGAVLQTGLRSQGASPLTKTSAGGALLYPSSTAMREPPTDPLLASVIAGRYRLDQRIATTDISVVYRASDTRNDNLYAVKILHAAREEVAKRCLREAEAMARVSNPHVVEAFANGILPTRNVYIVMEFLDGESLSELLDREGALPWPRVIRLARQIAEAVAATHAEGLIHRDIKPGNCMRITRGDDLDFIKLLDFGISKNVDARFPTLTTEGAVLGTPAYMAPELTATGQPEIRSDVYSFGVTLYQLLTGTLPFAGETLVDFYYHHTYTPLTPPSQRGAVSLPRELEDLVLRAMDKKPSERFPSMVAMIEVLDALMPTGERPPPLDIRPRSTTEAHPSASAAPKAPSTADIETVTSARPYGKGGPETRHRDPQSRADGEDPTPESNADLRDGTPMPFATTMTAATPSMSGSARGLHKGRETPLPPATILLRAVLLVTMIGLFWGAWRLLEPPPGAHLEPIPVADGIWVNSPPPLRPLPTQVALKLRATPSDAINPALPGAVVAPSELPQYEASDPSKEKPDSTETASDAAAKQEKPAMPAKVTPPAVEPAVAPLDEPLSAFSRRDATRRS
ncbi:MAG TPA: serine/threonine protein kinase, partial [Nannocystis exedens]|nr:serine/threonine protein kinase [Nannocystis exedens]